jgi:hypothetical protein
MYTWSKRRATCAQPQAKLVDDNGDVYFVPAFSGLFAPYWREDARGTIVGMTMYTNQNHICRAVIESMCYQVAHPIPNVGAAMGANGCFVCAPPLCRLCRHVNCQRFGSGIVQDRACSHPHAVPNLRLRMC